jgi:DNA-binding transcriptional LysR family regulator
MRFNSPMDKLRAMQTYVAVVEAGSLTAAARRLDTSLSAVVRSLAALEGALGVRLLTRSTRRMSVTEEGAEYLRSCKEILAATEQADAATQAKRQRPMGRLRVTAPVTFGQHHVAPVVASYLARYPEMRIDLLLVDRLVDLIEEQVDVAVRIGELPDSMHVAVPLGQTLRVVCASPQYLLRNGTPATPRELQQAHRCIAYSGFSAGGSWQFKVNGKASRVPIDVLLSVNHVETAIDACCAGLGVGTFLEYQVRAALREGRLVRVLARHEKTALPVNLLAPQLRSVSQRVRSFVDWAAPLLRDSLEGR